MSKPHVLLEACFAVANHGFASEFDTDNGTWNGLVEVSPVILLNLGEHDLAEDLRRDFGDGTQQAWIVENDGHRFVKFVAPVKTKTARKHLSLWEAFEKIATHLSGVSHLTHGRNHS